jgi:hypothetical protein
MFLMIGLTCGAWCTVSACAGFFGFEELVAERAEGGAAGSSGTGGAAGSSGEGGATGNGGEDGAAGNSGSSGAPMSLACRSFGVPEQPMADAGTAGSEGAGAAAGSYVFAVSKLDVGFETPTQDGSGPAGFNLDRTCTDTRNQGSCVNNNSFDAFDLHTKDKPGGVDNAGYELLKVIGAAYEDLLPGPVSERLKEGSFGLVARVEHYNGMADDMEVTVTVQPAWGVYDDDGKVGKTPDFNETDLWATDSYYFFPSEDDIIPMYTSSRAYVRGQVLVAKFPQLNINIGMPRSSTGNPSRPLEILLKDAWLVGELTMRDGQMSIDNGICAGRWHTTDLFSSMRQLAVGIEGDPQSNCDRSLDANDLFRLRVCAARDLVDGDQPGLPCNSISAAIRFTASPASPATFTNKPADFIVRADEGTCDKYDCDEK